MSRELDPLRKAGNLTTYRRDAGLQQSAITVIATGGQLNPVLALEHRDIFFDAPLAELATNKFDFDPTISPLSSCDYSRVVAGLPNRDRRTIIARLKELVAEAHRRGSAFRNSV